MTDVFAITVLSDALKIAEMFPLKNQRVYMGHYAII